MRPLHLLDLAAFGGAYGHDLAENPRAPGVSCSFSAFSAYEPLIEARRAGHAGVRIGLCEGAEGLRLEGDRVVGISDRLLQSVDVLQEAARLHGLYVSWTLLDGRGVEWADDAITRQILRDPDASLAFARSAAASVLGHLDPAVCAGVTLVREPSRAGVAIEEVARFADIVAAEAPAGWSRPLTVAVRLESLAALHSASASLRAAEVVSRSQVPDAEAMRAALPEALHDAPWLCALEDASPESLAAADAAGFFALAHR